MSQLSGVGTRDKGRFGWPIQTYNGGRFYPLDPRPNEINIFDVAHALSMICRYGGHCIQFYSVGEHCCRVSDYLLNKYGPMIAYHGLLHDASEAYLLDIPRPLKKWWLFKLIYEHFERKMDRAVAARFGLAHSMPRQVKDADNILLATERRDNMEPVDWIWNGMVEPLPEKIEPWTPADAEERFLERYHVLSGLVKSRTA